MVPVDGGIWLLKEHLEQMRRHVSDHLPEEACGLVAGKELSSVWVYPVENKLHSPVRFRMDPKQQVIALFEIDEKDWELLAIFHSHPDGPPYPSPTDIAEAFYPEAASIIWFLHERAWICKAFSVSKNGSKEIPIFLK